MSSLTPVCHHNGTVTYWSIYQQNWEHRAAQVPERELVAMAMKDRARVVRHLAAEGLAAARADAAAVRAAAATSKYFRLARAARTQPQINAAHAAEGAAARALMRLDAARAAARKWAS